MFIVFACVYSWTSISGGMGVGESLQKKKIKRQTLVEQVSATFNSIHLSPDVIHAASLLAEAWMPAQSYAQ